MPRKIKDIEITEITLCKSPANRKKFFIQKMEEKAMLKELKKFMSEDEETVEEALTDEEIKKAEALPEESAKALKPALEVINEYKDDLPEDILGAIQTIAKQAAFDYPVPEIDEKAILKAGAKLSKSTLEKIRKAIAMLMDLAGDEPVKTKKSGAAEEENLTPETEAKLERLEELEKAEKERIEKAEIEKAKKAEQEKKDLEARIEALEKGKPIKKSIDGQEGDKPGKKVKKGAGGEGEDDDIDHYPSMQVLVPGGALSED